MKKRTKKQLIIGSIVVVSIVGFFVYINGRTVPVEYTSLVVEKGDFLQTVEETGVIDTEISITYGWDTNGRIVEVLKQVGDVVSTTDVIAELDKRTEVNARRQAIAQRDAAVARLNEVLVGVTDEEKQTYQARIGQAEASLSQAETDMEQVTVNVASEIATAERAVESALNNVQEIGDTTQQVLDAYADLLNTLHANIPDLRDALTESDNILGINNLFADDDFEAYLGQEDISAKNGAEYKFPFVEAKIDALSLTLNTLSNTSAESALDAAALQTQEVLQDMNELLGLVLDALDGTRAQGTLTQTELDALKTGVIIENTTISTNRTALTNAIQAVTTAKNAEVTNQIAYTDATAALASLRSTGAARILSAERLVDIRRASLVEAQAAYNALVATPRAVDVAALRADVARQQAAVEAAQIKVDDKSLIAIAPGTITELDISVGENITANQDVVTLQSDTFKIEVDISESDIAKVSLGDLARVELDAYSDVFFLAHVTQIDPAATEISGVVYYSVELMLEMNMVDESAFSSGDVAITPFDIAIPSDSYDIRPGMSADIEIITYATMDTLSIPRRAIITTDNIKQVRVVTNPDLGTFELRDIQVGITGNDGKVEVVEGIYEGDEIITFIEESK